MEKLPARQQLDERLAEINRLLDVLETDLWNSICRAQKIGIQLLLAKQLVKHGEWRNWVEANLPKVGVRQTQKFMKIAENFDILEEKIAQKRIPNALLTIDDAAKLLAEPKPKKGKSEGLSIVERLEAIGATEEQIQAFLEYTADSQEELLEAIEDERVSLDQAIETGEIPELPIEQVMKRENKDKEAFCREIEKAFKDGMPNGPWMLHQGRNEGALRKMKDALAYIRGAKCTNVCPLCEGDGCRHCLQTGMMPTVEYQKVTK